MSDMRGDVCWLLRFLSRNGDFCRDLVLVGCRLDLRFFLNSSNWSSDGNLETIMQIVSRHFLRPIGCAIALNAWGIGVVVRLLDATGLSGNAWGARVLRRISGDMSTFADACRYYPENPPWQK